jgi:hypothetical protein
MKPHESIRRLTLNASGQVTLEQFQNGWNACLDAAAEGIELDELPKGWPFGDWFNYGWNACLYAIRGEAPF